jgi:hypothetical protein
VETHECFISVLPLNKTGAVVVVIVW